MKKIYTQFFKSATLMTWSNFIVKFGGLGLILVLALSKLGPEQVALWLIFQTIISLNMLLDLGFVQSFSRSFSYAYSGAQELNEYQNPVVESRDHSPNFKLLADLYATSKYAYFYLMLFSFFILLSIGTFFVYDSIEEINSNYWIAWYSILVVSPIVLFGNLFISILQGTNNVALYNKWDAIIGIVHLPLLILFFYLYPNLNFLVIGFLIGQIIKIIKNYLLIKRQHICSQVLQIGKYDTNIFKTIFSSAWRSALGILFGYGIIQLSGLVYSKLVNPIEAATYLLALRIIYLISDISRPPFYSQLPRFTILYNQNKISELLQVVKKRMFISHLIFIVIFLFVGIFSEFVLKIINSETHFVDSLTWVILGVAIFLERYGAMHIQLYSLTNHIVWHIATGVSGIIFIILTYLFYGFLFKELYSFPLAILASNLLFYSWYCAKKSYTLFKSSFLNFESRSFIPAFFLIIIFSFLIYYFPNGLNNI